MLIKTVFPVEELAGTIGMGASPAEATFYKRNGLQCARQYVFPTYLNTGAQQVVKFNFSAAAAYWTSHLTDAQRTAWVDYAALNPVIIKGQSVNIGGLAMFVRYAVHNLNFGITIDPNPPSSGGVPAPDPNVYTASPPIWTVTGGEITCTVDGNPATTLGYRQTLEVTGVLPGSQNARETDYKYVRNPGSNEILTRTTTALSSQEITVSGLVTPPATSRYGWRVRYWSTGRLVPIFEATGIQTVQL